MTKKLLLADDSVTIQKVVSISFANEDVKVLTVDNGDDALVRARETIPDVVLADVQMPGCNGYEVCEALKSEPSLRHIPVLLLSGTFETFDEERARAAGAAGHVTKPFEAQVLVERVNELLAASDSVEAIVEEAADDDSLGFDLLEDPVEATDAPAATTVVGRVEPITVMSQPSEVPVTAISEADPFDDAATAPPDATVALMGDVPPPLPAAGPVRAAEWDADDAFDWPTEGAIETDLDTPPGATTADAVPPPLPTEAEGASDGYDEIFDFDIERGTADEDVLSAVEPNPALDGEPDAEPWERTVWSPEPVTAAPAGEPWEDAEPSPPEIEPPSVGFRTLTNAEDAAETELTAEAVPEPDVDAGGTVSPALRRELQASLEKVAWDAFGDLSERIVKDVLARVEAVAWEVIPQMAETLIRDEIRRLKSEE